MVNNRYIKLIFTILIITAVILISSACNLSNRSSLPPTAVAQPPPTVTVTVTVTAPAGGPARGPAVEYPEMQARPTLDGEPLILNGTVMDINGNMVTVQNGAAGANGNTIYAVYSKTNPIVNIQPGVSVSVHGTFQKGVVNTDTVQQTAISPAWPAPATPAQPSGKIEHIIYLIQENHSFDNYFGTFPGAEGFPPNLKVPEHPGGTPTVAPFHFTLPLLHDMNHDPEIARAAVDGGKMDGFIEAERSVDTMGYYDGSDISNYWSYARQFVLMDHYFSSLMGPSLPNHLYTVAGQSGAITRNLMRPPEDGFDFPEIAETLQNAKISWKYYDGKQNPQAYSIWNPLPGFPEFENSPELMSHLVSITQYFHDLREGTLPAVSWIVPNGAESEHPPSTIRARNVVCNVFN